MPKVNSIIAQSVQTPYDLYYINGAIKTPNGKLVSKANVSVSGKIAANFINNTNSKYNFNVPKGDYTIKPKKNNDIAKNNGVSAIDVILVQNHILSKIKLNSPNIRRFINIISILVTVLLLFTSAAIIL